MFWVEDSIVCLHFVTKQTMDNEKTKNEEIVKDKFLENFSFLRHD
jgi:hypothetical protein